MVDKAVAKARNVVGAIGVSEAPTVKNDIDSARAALALVSDAVTSRLTKD